MTGYQQYTREEAIWERKVGVHTSTNYVIDQPHEVLVNFSPYYDLEDMPQRSVSIFDRLSLVQPRNRHAQPLSALRNRQQAQPLFALKNK